ncbi:CG3893 [Drosophila busckii]|uniref:CG3893 n=2 Tax=Drosophila busckii TaxID=30019 RepID=A0A0M4EIT6_DROBS|nr:CG3893 [Drosophila busckii]
MLRKRLQQHIIKCKEHYKDEKELMVCPFNKAHLVTELEFHQHTKTCADRSIIEHYQLSAPAELDDQTKHDTIEADENWDDVDVPDYNPQAYASSANIVREPNGMFPSQRKAFVKEERKRLLGDQCDIEEERPTKSAKTPKSPSSTPRSAPYKIPHQTRK